MCTLTGPGYPALGVLPTLSGSCRTPEAGTKAPERSQNGSVPAHRLRVRPGAAGRAETVLDVDEPGVDLPVAVGRLADAGPGPRGVEELRDPVGGAGRVLRVGVPAALLA